MTICWHKPGPWRTRCRENHSGHLYISYGRCRSGRRWFWNVQVIDYGIGSPSEHGWSDSEAQALEDAREVVIRFAAGRPAVAGPSHGKASYRLRELNAEKRRARPPSDVKDSRVVEYLYSNSWGSEYGLLHFCRFRITKRTAKRVYYLRKDEPIDEHGEPIDFGNIKDLTVDDDIGFVDRQKLAAEGHVYNNRGRHWSSADYQLYASLEGLLTDLGRNRKPEERLDLAALKAAMAAAHPDKGGSPAAFTEARQRYVAARRAGPRR